MNAWIAPIAGIVIAIVIPFAVNLCTTTNCSGQTKRIIALVFSMAGGVACGFLSGMPTPETLLTWMLAVLGGVQTAYTAFKSVGVTSNWLEAALNIGVKG